MCNLYQLNTPNSKELADYFGAYVPELFEWMNVIGPKSIGPGIMLNDNTDRELHPMQFGLAPIGSKTPSDPKRLLNNARIESIDKWPWKVPFASQRCVVPLSAFREPCYWGEVAGKEVYFSSPTEPFLSVAAIYNQWQSPDKNTKLLTMSFLMRPACDFVMDHGHHRQPLFIQKEGIDEWMSGNKRDPDESKAILRKYIAEPELSCTIERQMKEGWQKRQPGKLETRDKQLEVIRMLGMPYGF